jgi:hypothetical protein
MKSIMKSVPIVLLICFWVFMSAFIPRNERPSSEGNFRFGIGRTVIVEERANVDSAVSIGGDVQVFGHVRKDVVALGGSVYLAPLSRVDGNISVIGGQVMHQDGAMVGGKISVINPGSLDSILSSFPRDGFDLFYRLVQKIGWISSIGFIILALIISAVMPSIIGAVSHQIEHNAMGALFLGVLGSMAVFPILMMLFISVMGIVLIPLEIMLVGSSMIIGYIAVSQLIGKRMTISLGRPNQPLLMETVLGLAVLFLAGFLPFFGFMAKGFVTLIGFGGVIDVVFFGWTRRQNAS